MNVPTNNIIARFADGRLMVRQELAAPQQYYGDGVGGKGIVIRMKHVRMVERVLSVDNSLSYLGLVSPLGMVSGNNDLVTIRLFRGDQGASISGLTNGTSGFAALGLLSNITSGLSYMGEVLSGTPISGQLKLIVNAIGF